MIITDSVVGFNGGQHSCKKKRFEVVLERFKKGVDVVSFEVFRTDFEARSWISSVAAARGAYAS